MIIIDFFYRYINMQSYISTYFKLFWDLAFYIFNFFLEFTFIFTKPRRHFFLLCATIVSFTRPSKYFLYTSAIILQNTFWGFSPCAAATT